MIRVVYSPAMLGYTVYRYEKAGDSMRFWTQDGNVKSVKEGEENPPYWLRLTDEDIDDILKGAIKHGYEPNLPNDDSYQAGKLQAMTEHLADMRRLVMDGIPGDKD